MNSLASSSFPQPAVIKTQRAVRPNPDRDAAEVGSAIPRVAMIGGGPGGLMTAYLLQKKAPRPVAVTIFEASPRVGGKILTPEFSLAPVRYEAGAAEFYDYSPVDVDPLKNLVQELGLPLTRMGGSGVVMGNRLLSNLDELETQFGIAARREWSAFHRRTRDRMSPTEFYLSGGDESTPTCHVAEERDRFAECLTGVKSDSLRQFIQVLIHSDLATEPEHTNIEYGLQNYVMNDPAYMQLYGIEGGNQRLPEELVRRCRADVRLQHRVRSVRTCEPGPQSGGFEVQFSVAGEEAREIFDQVVVALPHDALPHLEFSGARLQSAMRQHYDHFHHPAHYLRLTLLFRRPFWQGKLNESYWMLDAFGGSCLYDESSRLVEPEYGVLGFLLGGADAVSYAQMSDDHLCELALDRLPAFLGDARRHYLEGRVHRWLGAVNAIPGGRTPLPIPRRHCPEPVENSNLWVVGDYLYDATLNGVFDSADYVSSGIAVAVSRRG